MDDPRPTQRFRERESNTTADLRRQHSLETTIQYRIYNREPTQRLTSDTILLRKANLETNIQYNYNGIQKRTHLKTSTHYNTFTDRPILQLRTYLENTVNGIYNFQSQFLSPIKDRSSELHVQHTMPGILQYLTTTHYYQATVIIYLVSTFVAPEEVLIPDTFGCKTIYFRNRLQTGNNDFCVRRGQLHVYDQLLFMHKGPRAPEYSFRISSVDRISHSSAVRFCIFLRHRCITRRLEL